MLEFDLQRHLVQAEINALFNQIQETMGNKEWKDESPEIPLNLLVAEDILMDLVENDKSLPEIEKMLSLADMKAS